MSNSKQTTEKPTSEQAVLKALASNPEATAAEVAAAANVGRSTASKVLARLASTGEVCRTEGGRDGARRLPDRFALVSAEPAAKTAKANSPAIARNACAAWAEVWISVTPCALSVTAVAMMMERFADERRAKSDEREDCVDSADQANCKPV